jgi:hypothetical protein
MHRPIPRHPLKPLQSSRRVLWRRRLSTPITKQSCSCHREGIVLDAARNCKPVTNRRRRLRQIFQRGRKNQTAWWSLRSGINHEFRRQQCAGVVQGCQSRTTAAHAIGTSYRDQTRIRGKSCLARGRNSCIHLHRGATPTNREKDSRIIEGGFYQSPVTNHQSLTHRSIARQLRPQAPL